MLLRGTILLLLMLPTPLMAADSYPAGSVLSGSMRVLGGLVLVLGLVLLIYAVIKKRGGILPGQKNSEIKLIETRHLAPKKAVVLVEVRGKSMLIGLGNESVSLLCLLDPPAHNEFSDELQKQMEQQPCAPS